MKSWLFFPIHLVIWGLFLATAAAAERPEMTAAIRAIEQAPDPSAVVAAYADGAAIDRNEPGLYEAYAARMVDLGLPELAYHQAQTLTALQPTNGLAWAVIAYGNARQGKMPEAMSAIIRAGELARDNAFVQRTAGELVAWYDAQENLNFPDTLKEGVAKIRGLIAQQTAFRTAYETARNAYREQAGTNQPPAAAAPSQSAVDQIAPLGATNTASMYGTEYYTAPLAPAEYYYDWGPNWVAPDPWWWWQPAGFFGGLTFFPQAPIIVFHDRHHHRHPGHFNHGFHRHFSHFDGKHSFHHHGQGRFFKHDGKGHFVTRHGVGKADKAGFFGLHAVPNVANHHTRAHPNRHWAADAARAPGVAPAATAQRAPGSARQAVVGSSRLATPANPQASARPARTPNAVAPRANTAAPNPNRGEAIAAQRRGAPAVTTPRTRIGTANRGAPRANAVVPKGRSVVATPPRSAPAVTTPSARAPRANAAVPNGRSVVATPQRSTPAVTTPSARIGTANRVAPRANAVVPNGRSVIAAPRSGVPAVSTPSRMATPTPRVGSGIAGRSMGPTLPRSGWAGSVQPRQSFGVARGAAPSGSALSSSALRGSSAVRPGFRSGAVAPGGFRGGQIHGGGGFRGGAGVPGGAGRGGGFHRGGGGRR